jgi:ribosomal protein S2
VALANTDCDVQGIAYTVPGNDSAQKSIKYFLDASIAQVGGARTTKKA